MHNDMQSNVDVVPLPSLNNGILAVDLTSTLELDHFYAGAVADITGESTTWGSIRLEHSGALDVYDRLILNLSCRRDQIRLMRVNIIDGVENQGMTRNVILKNN